jgi:hypothetical protein
MGHRTLLIASRTRGRTKAFRGVPCPNGHDGLRYKSTRACVQCKRESGRTGFISRGTHLDAVRRQPRYIRLFEKNYSSVSRKGIGVILSAAYHSHPLQRWVYNKRSRWKSLPHAMRLRLLRLGEEGWWLRTAPPRHQTRTGMLVGSAEHKRHKLAVNKVWRDRRGDYIRADQRRRYSQSPALRKRIAAARSLRFRASPGLAAYLRSRRRARERFQRCTCCSDAQIRSIYLRHGSLRLETDHKVSLAIAEACGWTGMHCVRNLQGLTRAAHRRKTTTDIGELAAIRRSSGAPYHKSRAVRGQYLLRNASDHSGRDRP